VTRSRPPTAGPCTSGGWPSGLRRERCLVCLGERTGRVGGAVTRRASPVEVEDIRKTYRSGIEALKGVSFAEGEIFGLLGPNGAGKTTMVGILTTIVRPTAGRALVASHDVVRDPLSVRSAIGVAFQDSVLDTEFSGRENLRLHARLWGMPRRDAEARIDFLLDAMGLTARATDGIRSYSGGMRRRLEIARALLANPRSSFWTSLPTGLTQRCAMRSGF
jgi:ABC-2 type transport system ATP-binding protein